MNKKNKIISIIVSVVIAVVAFFGGYVARYYFADDDVRAIRDLVEKYKKHYYYDDGNIVKDISNAILDEYSTYYTAEEFQEILNGAQGNFKGIGLGFTIDSLYVATVLGNSPCEKAGVKSGGTLTAINFGSGDFPVKNIDEFTAVLNSVPDDKDFTITINYGGVLKEFTVAKKDYKRTYVHYYDNLGYNGFSDASGEMQLVKLSDNSVIENSSVGYIVYESFNGTDNNLNGSAKQIEEVLNKFKLDGKKNIIFDLRDNGGGYMDILSKVVSHFIDAGDNKKALISVAIDKYGKREEFFSSKCDYSKYGFENIIILANENSASASEAFIGAVLDYDKNGIVKVLVSSSISKGEKVYRTYGKGIMQNTFINLDGSAVKLTTAEIFWPVSNVSIHKKGVVGEDSGKVLKVEKENALNYALELLK